MKFDSRDLLDLGIRNGTPILEFWQRLSGGIVAHELLGEGTIVGARRNAHELGGVTVDLRFGEREIGIGPLGLGPPTVLAIRIPDSLLAATLSADIETVRQARLDAELERQRAEQARQEQMEREAAEKARAVEEDRARERAALNVHRQFDLVLFDLDDTLVLTSRLEKFRGKENVGNIDAVYIRDLAAQAAASVRLIGPSELVRLREISPELKLGVFTRSRSSTRKRSSERAIRT